MCVRARAFESFHSSKVNGDGLHTCDINVYMYQIKFIHTQRSQHIRKMMIFNEYKNLLYVLLVQFLTAFAQYTYFRLAFVRPHITLPFVRSFIHLFWSLFLAVSFSLDFVRCIHHIERGAARGRISSLSSTLTSDSVCVCVVCVCTLMCCACLRATKDCFWQNPSKWEMS